MVIIPVFECAFFAFGVWCETAAVFFDGDISGRHEIICDPVFIGGEFQISCGVLSELGAVDLDGVFAEDNFFSGVFVSDKDDCVRFRDFIEHLFDCRSIAVGDGGVFILNDGIAFDELEMALDDGRTGDVQFFNGGGVAGIIQFSVPGIKGDELDTFHFAIACGIGKNLFVEFAVFGVENIVVSGGGNEFV